MVSPVDVGGVLRAFHRRHLFKLNRTHVLVVKWGWQTPTQWFIIGGSPGEAVPGGTWGN